MACREPYLRILESLQQVHTTSRTRGTCRWYSNQAYKHNHRTNNNVTNKHLCQQKSRSDEQRLNGTRAKHLPHTSRYTVASIMIYLVCRVEASQMSSTPYILVFQICVPPRPNKDMPTPCPCWWWLQLRNTWTLFSGPGSPNPIFRPGPFKTSRGRV